MALFTLVRQNFFQLQQSLPVLPPVLPFLLAYMSGICGYFPLTRKFVGPGLLPLCGLLLALFLVHYKNRKIIPIIVLLAFSGYLTPSLPDLNRPSNHILNHIQEGKTTSIEGRLYTSPRILKDRTYYRIRLDSLNNQPVTGTAQVSVYKPHNVFKPGDRIQFNKIRLKVPRNFRNPGRFNYHLYLKSKGIDVTGNISRPETMEKTGHFDLPLLHEGPQQLRNHLVKSLEKLFPGEEGALLKAMVLGMKDSLPVEVRENYMATGLAHLMAVSGLHIGFIAASSYFVLWPIVFHGLYRMKPDSVRAGDTRKITAALCLIPVLFYMVVVGAKVSSIRAGIMVSALLIAIIFDRQNSLFNAFLTAAFIILLWKPESVIDVGFQLSFLAVGGILAVFNLFSKINNDPILRMGEPAWSQKLTRPSPAGIQVSLVQYLKYQSGKILMLGALVSVTVTAVTLPVLIYQFNRISLAGIFLNILLVPLASALIPAVLLLTLAGTVSTTLPKMAALPAILIAKVFSWVPEFFSKFSFSSFHVPTPPSIWMVFYFSALLTGFNFLRNLALNQEGSNLNNKCFIVLVLLVLVLFIWPRAIQFPGNNLSITVLDVGQGESLIIEFPNGKTLVMDGGGFYKNRFDVGGRVVAPFLWKRGIRNIDYMVATHSDNDHIRGLYSLIDLFPVKNFITIGNSFAGQRLNRLQNHAQKKGARLLQLKFNKPELVGKVQLIPLHPEPDKSSKSNQRVDNDLSLVLRLEYKNFSMLFTGDISDKVEKILARNPQKISVDILKGPHHGSRFSNSPDFIKAVNPDTVIFSSGYLNRMRHPHPETLERYQNVGVDIRRTDTHGAVQVISDGNHYEIHTHETL